MRVTSGLYVSALVRRVFAEGGFAAVARRGSESAGAVFIIVRDRMGAVALYGPAPQTGYADAKPDDRLFVRLPDADEEAVARRLERETRFDADLWLVEIEPAGPDAERLFSVAKE